MNAGEIAPVAALDGLEVSFSVEWGRDASGSMELLMWLGAGCPLRFLNARSLWMLWRLGAPQLLRFERRSSFFNRACFEVVEVLPAHARSQLPPDAVWFPSEPRCQPIGATS